MNKKLLVFVGLIALGIGGISTIALQSYAQKAPIQPATTAASVVSTSTQENTSADADNIQDDKNGIEKPDAAISQDTDNETNDDKSATSTVRQGDTKEQGENSAADVNETEDGN